MHFIADVVVTEANRKHLHVDDDPDNLPLKAFVEKDDRRCESSNAAFNESENILEIYAPMIECGESKVKTFISFFHMPCLNPFPPFSIKTV